MNLWLHYSSSSLFYSDQFAAIGKQAMIGVERWIVKFVAILREKKEPQDEKQVG